MADKKPSETKPSETKPEDSDSKTAPVSGKLQIEGSKNKFPSIDAAQVNSETKPPSTGLHIADSKHISARSEAQNVDIKDKPLSVETTVDSKSDPPSVAEQKIGGSVKHLNPAKQNVDKTAASISKQRMESKFNSLGTVSEKVNSEAKPSSVFKQNEDSITNLINDEEQKSKPLSTNAIDQEIDSKTVTKNEKEQSKTETPSIVVEDIGKKTKFEEQKVDDNTKFASTGSQKTKTESNASPTMLVSETKLRSEIAENEEDTKSVESQNAAMQENLQSIDSEKQGSSEKHRSLSPKPTKGISENSGESMQSSHASQKRQSQTPAEKDSDSTKHMNISENTTKHSSTPGSILKKSHSSDSPNRISKSMYTIKESSTKPSSTISSTRMKSTPTVGSTIPEDIKEGKKSKSTTSNQKKDRYSRIESNASEQEKEDEDNKESIEEAEEDKKGSCQLPKEAASLNKLPSTTYLHDGSGPPKEKSDQYWSSQRDESDGSKSKSSSSQRESMRKSQSEYSRSTSTKSAKTKTPSTLIEKDITLRSSLTLEEEEQYDIINIPIQYTRMSIFGDEYCKMREKFLFELRRMEEEIEHFSNTLKKWYGRTRSMSMLRIPSDNTIYRLCPYIQDAEAPDKALKLTFDVSHFDPSEVSVNLVNKKTLRIAAKHEEETNGRSIYKEYKRELLIPRRTEPESIITCHFRDGILTIEAPFNYPRDDSFLSVPSLDPSVSTYISSLNSDENEPTDFTSELKETTGAEVLSSSQKEEVVEGSDIVSASLNEVEGSTIDPDVMSSGEKETAETKVIGASMSEVTSALLEEVTGSKLTTGEQKDGVELNEYDKEEKEIISGSKGSKEDLQISVDEQNVITSSKKDSTNNSYGKPKYGYNSTIASGKAEDSGTTAPIKEAVRPSLGGEEKEIVGSTSVSGNEQKDSHLTSGQAGKSDERKALDPETRNKEASTFSGSLNIEVGSVTASVLPRLSGTGIPASEKETKLDSDTRSAPNENSAATPSATAEVSAATHLEPTNKDLSGIPLEDAAQNRVASTALKGSSQQNDSGAVSTGSTQRKATTADVIGSALKEGSVAVTTGSSKEVVSDAAATESTPRKASSATPRESVQKQTSGGTTTASARKQPSSSTAKGSVREETSNAAPIVSTEKEVSGSAQKRVSGTLTGPAEKETSGSAPIGSSQKQTSGTVAPSSSAQKNFAVIPMSSRQKESSDPATTGSAQKVESGASEQKTGSGITNTSSKKGRNDPPSQS